MSDKCKLCWVGYFKLRCAMLGGRPGIGEVYAQSFFFDVLAFPRSNARLSGLRRRKAMVDADRIESGV